MSSEALALYRFVSRLRHGRVWVALATGLLLASCASERMGLPQIGGGKTVAPQAAPRVTGVESSTSREHKRLVAMFGGEYKAPAAERISIARMPETAVAVPALTRARVPGSARHVDTVVASPAASTTASA